MLFHTIDFNYDYEKKRPRKVSKQQNPILWCNKTIKKLYNIKKTNLKKLTKSLMESQYILKK